MEAYISLTITKIIEEIKGVKSFYFAENEKQRLSYKAGQYLTFILPTISGEIRRSYSIASAPELNEPLFITLQRVENGLFSRFLIDEAKPGDKLLTTGVRGFFTLPENMDAVDQFFFFAAGSGITPIFSLIKTLLHAHKRVFVRLIYSNHSEETTIFREEIIRYSDLFPDRFAAIFINSSSKYLDRARLYPEFIMRLFNKYSMAETSKTLFYLCGPENYMRMCTYGIGLLGASDSQIRKENFTSLKVVPKIKPPDTDAHNVHFQIYDQQYQVKVQYPETILKAIKKLGLKLSYSCETGRCGSCVATCVKGKVWMSYNEVLTEKEISKGLVLTCVGYPIEGDVLLKI